ncbi:ATP synthase subunit e, mitochondrial [Coccinella septempunctata]|uniref:ATP synthase subunit e, mitochondrial n=1 Tax=Coccinella septempunctata TaxID=41139 RepID=UPI001D061BA1|nr:ATP synthase subunit e, mitochondrial [Coccinella septempunctata]
MSLPPPVQVAPLIKFARWSLLSVGVVYGAFHQRRFSKKEARLREIEEQHREAREAQLLIENKARQEKEMKELEALMNPKAVA